MFILLAPSGASILVRRSRGEAFRSAEARPLAADWPLRVGLRACYVLRPRPLLTSFPGVRHPPEDPRGRVPLHHLFGGPMLQEQVPTPQPAARPPVRIGVGIDTARYGHYAACLGDDHQPAADELAFAASAAGYAQLRQRLEGLAQRHEAVTFVFRLDAAGPYADNLRHFLQHLGPSPQRPTGAIPHADCALSWGDPQRNKNYRAALFGSKK